MILAINKKECMSCTKMHKMLENSGKMAQSTIENP